MPPECISFKEISKASFDMVEKLEPSHAVGRNENWGLLSGDSLTAPQEAKHIHKHIFRTMHTCSCKILRTTHQS